MTPPIAAAVAPPRRATLNAPSSETYERFCWFFSRLLVLLSQKVAFWELGILDNFGRFVFRHEELRWITQ
jgi:hypothetical protein